jgi:hypothetical protein
MLASYATFDLFQHKPGRDFLIKVAATDLQTKTWPNIE